MRRTILILFFLALFLLVPLVQAADTNELVALGNAALDAKKYSEALTHFNNALAQDAKHATALSGKATALNALGNFSAALEAADASLALRSSRGLSATRDTRTCR